MTEVCILRLLGEGSVCFETRGEGREV